MTTLRWRTLPFRYTTNSDFYVQLNKWLTAVFYDFLPAAGFEIREEQICISYKLVSALRQKEVLLAEAGSGTGKTFAYLLPALCYARLTGLPTVIACSSTALQEQLVQAHGDIRTLSGLLNLDIKAILAKDPENYVCAVQSDLAKISLPRHPLRSQFIQWLETTTTGDRTEMPGADDALWAEVAYNSSLDCAHCRRRGYCHLARARQSLWAEQDFIVCSHDIFFKDLWSRRQNLQKEMRQLEMVQTKMPYLPTYSAVVFDEGHLIEAPALRHLGVKVNKGAVSRVATVFSGLPLATDALLTSLEKLEQVNQRFFGAVSKEAVPLNHRQSLIKMNAALKARSRELLQVIEESQEEMAMYQQFDVNQYIQELDACAQGLSNLICPDSVTWWEPDKGDLWVLPRDFSQALGRELLAQQIPVIFTSATLDSGNDFAYIKRITGLEQAKTSQVDTSFDLAKQMEIYLPGDLANTEEKIERCASLLRENGGRALILCADASETELLYNSLRTRDFDFSLLKEGDQDSSLLIQEFRQDETSVLIGTGFWEGIDIPGDALTMVIVYSLPFPAEEPLALAKREATAAEGLDPYQAIDFPAMSIKLRQGIGRLIRSNEDYGLVAILGCGTDAELRRKVAQELQLSALQSDKLEDRPRFDKC
ncbi:MAG: ATP-dependent DNA helicase [Eubacteriales bacterium]|nr:ATP-dependent DNA helicase [Eubacteriales bacterium]